MMARTRCWPALGLLLLAAAGPARRRAPPLPLPPLPPLAGAPGRTAPVPDLFAREPAPPPEIPGQPAVGPAWFASRSVSASQGFIPGSQVEARPNGRTELAPGLSLRLPLK